MALVEQCNSSLALKGQLLSLRAHHVCVRVPQSQLCHVWHQPLRRLLLMLRAAHDGLPCLLLGCKCSPLCLQLGMRHSHICRCALLTCLPGLRVTPQRSSPQDLGRIWDYAAQLAIAACPSELPLQDILQTTATMASDG